MKNYYINNCIITKLNSILKESYNSKYLITFNHDIIGFADTLKEAKNIIKKDIF